ncbi:MAG: DNA glycosylase [Clostridia bacterium]|nr:DNA glycosylase [Clostridia bacterium]
MEKPYVISVENGVMRIGGTSDFSVFSTFDCGQCFRFDAVEGSEYKTEYAGVARGRKVGFAQNGPGEIYVIGAKEEDFPLWSDYLALDVDYDAMNREMIESVPEGEDRETMRRAVAASAGIRILRQDRWEALCSFIVSQNNNIPRIKKIISALCEKYGADIGGAYDFPTAKALAAAGEEEIFALRTGFRAKYISSAAKTVAEDDEFLERVACAPSYGDAESLLVSLKGVGPKVAACTLLFGFERYDAFPVDVWIKKVLSSRFSESFDYHVLGSSAGVAQQYLFYFERYLGGNVEK